ncbi:tyrosine-type recombinase/integrase [Cupriavidus basilensis]|uniref:tyrosine-type recombinase/integrase n=1 Tax=Cupriavidus basilensis TaxID=68895 RepID=UPI0020A65458|nr:site-specific integrase [Cupriavidus basilensis]MCP3018017.1 site-specific integrase [Cupriavidus basilensis]
MASIIEHRGKFRATVTRKGHPRLVRTFEKRGDAERWSEQIESDIKLGKNIIATDKTTRYMTLEDLIDRYIEEVGAIKPIGVSKLADFGMIKNDEIGKVELRRIEEKNVVDFALRRRKAGSAPSTVAGNISHLSTVFRAAHGLFKLKEFANPIPAARETLKFLGVVGSSNTRSRRPSEDELTAIKGYFRGCGERQKIPMWDIVDFAVATAMRAGEITGLRWEDFNEAARTIVIRDRKDPREKKGNDQEVPLLIEAMEIILRQPRTENEPRIFPYVRGTVSRRFAKAVEELKIVDLHFHDLRHDGISRLFERGFTIPEVQLMSGHKTWAMLRRYTHIKPEAIHKRERPQLRIVA